MKLLYCLACSQVFSLTQDERSCDCGDTRGAYLDHLNAWYAGENAIPLGFANGSFVAAMRAQSDGLDPEEFGTRFTAFVIPKKCDSFENRTGGDLAL